MVDWVALLALVIVVLVVVGGVLGVVGFVMIRSLGRRVERLERERRNDAVAPGTSASAHAAIPVTPPTVSVPRSTPAAPLAKADEPSGRTAQPAARGADDWSDGSRRAPIAASAGSAKQSEGGELHRSPAPPPLGKSESAPAPASTSARIEWERWLGVRGAAVLGGVVVAIAGLLFLQYSIEHQLITPQTRVIIGAALGLVCFVAAPFLRQREYVVVANSITGAGAALLYAAAWAAHVLYGMIGFPAAFVAMVTVTAACAWFAARHGSLMIAVLGLVGGFATPIALATGQDRPIALFGYVLLIDLAFLFVAEKRRWPSLGLIALAGTFVMQALWIMMRMGKDGLPVALITLAVFALFFAAFIARLGGAEKRRWNTTQVGALILPFVFAIYFAQSHDLGEHVWPLAALAAVLSIAAGWIGRSNELAWLSVGSASGGVALAVTWSVNRAFTMTNDQATELVICALALVLVQLVVSEFAARGDRAGERARGARGGALVSALGFQLVVLHAASRPFEVGPWLWLATVVLCALAVMRQIALGSRELVGLATGLLVGATTFVWVGRHGTSAVMPPAQTFGIALGLIGALLLCAAWLVRLRAPRLPFWGVAGFVLPAQLCLLTLGRGYMEALAIHVAVAVVMGIQTALSATVARSSALFVVSVASTFVALLLTGTEADKIAPTAEFVPVFVTVLCASAIFAVWPVVRTDLWLGRPSVWRAAAFFTLPFFFLVRALFVARWPGAPVFYLPFGFEILAGVIAYVLFARRASEDRAQRIGRIWYSSAAVLFAAMIVPLQIDREPFAITLALFAAGVAAIHVRIDARPLAWVALGALVLSLLVLSLFRLECTFPHSSVRVLNWVAYTHLLPTVAAIITAVCLRRVGGGVAATIAGICAVLFMFVWINLEIANTFAENEVFSWRFGHTPARDLTVSIAWVVYALVLLMLGVSKQRGGLRWASLILMLVTIAKVFLFDLGHLEGLYRAASVFGLGLSLLTISVLYQRFVFRRPPPTS